MRTFTLTLLGLIAASSAFAAPTFSKDVAPILYKNCVACHRPGEMAPMSLLDYKSARPWAKTMQTAVVSRKMPPWFADPRYGHFQNDARLKDADIETIKAWVAGGALEGDQKDHRSWLANGRYLAAGRRQEWRSYTQRRTPRKALELSFASICEPLLNPATAARADVVQQIR